MYNGKFGTALDDQVPFHMFYKLSFLMCGSNKTHTWYIQIDYIDMGPVYDNRQQVSHFVIIVSTAVWSRNLKREHMDGKTISTFFCKQQSIHHDFLDSSAKCPTLFWVEPLGSPVFLLPFCPLSSLQTSKKNYSWLTQHHF